jgi:hypothetical protein
MRKVAIIIGSKSDLRQCYRGFQFLQEHREDIKVIKVHIRSQHRHTFDTQAILDKYANMQNGPDAIIIGAGWANHLTGCSDAFLRYSLKNDKISVFGVAFADLSDSPEADREARNQAAKLSISEVPGTQVIYHDLKNKRKERNNVFFGETGFLDACWNAAYYDLPKIELKEAPPIEDLSLEDALEAMIAMK